MHTYVYIPIYIHNTLIHLVCIDSYVDTRTSILRQAYASLHIKPSYNCDKHVTPVKVGDYDFANKQQ